MKSIVVPINLEAAQRLDLGQEHQGDLIEIEIDEATFDNLFSVGWVRQVNNAVGCNIDEHEDEHIETLSSLERFIEVSTRFAGDPNDIFTQIVTLAQQAKVRGTGLHFYF